MNNLPPFILKILDQYPQQLQLQRHLTIVYNMALSITKQLLIIWPDIPLNKEEIFFGAATHDIGKVIDTNELRQPGDSHKSSGYDLLISNGKSHNLARFTKTHGDWTSMDIKAEDLIVSLADEIWKGKRINELEERLSKEISVLIRESFWDVYTRLDKIISDTILGSDERLRWQNGEDFDN